MTKKTLAPLFLAVVASLAGCSGFGDPDASRDGDYGGRYDRYGRDTHDLERRARAGDPLAR